MKLYSRIFLVFGWVWCVGTAAADDIDAMGNLTLTIKPNVMIIFDTSGSMQTKDVPEDPYNKDADYAAVGYEKEVVYIWKHDTAGASWSELVHRDLLDPSCTAEHIDDALENDGQVWARINRDAPYNCDEVYDEVELRTGHFLSYESGGYPGPMRRRLDVAKTVVKKLIEDHPEVRFGLMRFTSADDQKSRVVPGGALSDHGDINLKPTVDQLKGDIDGFLADSDSPLAETLAEAGLYFAGQNSWYSAIRYTSPIDIKCRPNAIILMTDGESTEDHDPRLAQKNTYIGNGTIGDYDGDGKESETAGRGGNDYLDDVALFLYETDLMPHLGRGDSHYEKQNIITHAIGFRKTQPLLRDTAANGGGEYFTAGSRIALTRAFEKILDIIEKNRPLFGTPRIPVSRSNSVYAGDHLYLALHLPVQNSGQWRGNLKKYKLNASGELIDQNNQPATAVDGTLLDSAQSYWSSEVDGAQVDSGGAGALLVNRISRNLYTYFEGASKNLTDEVNAFTVSNEDNLTEAVLDVTSSDERKNVINRIHGVGRNWVMADVLHSLPTIVTYDTNGDKRVDQDDDALVFVGTNGGLLHAFWDSSGEESWGFIPPQHLARLKRLNHPDMAHGYALDGAPAVFTTRGNGGDSRKNLIFGERRGGSHYYVLDITKYDLPAWNYRIGEDILGKGEERLGQSWGQPQIVTIAKDKDSTHEVLLLPGGYDTQQDAKVPKDIDARGRAVFSVDADSGLLGPFRFSNDENHSDMTHCIVDLVGVDSDGDGVVNSIYAPDLGGNMFAFSDHDQDGIWNKLRLFNASSHFQRKIFFSPDVIRIAGDPDPDDDKQVEAVGEMVFFGTGDIAHPKETRCKNRFYAVKNFHWKEHFTTLTDIIDAHGDGDLHDATLNTIIQGDTLEAQQKAMTELKNRMGWFIDLEAEGEKMVSTPVVYNQAVYFTTYIPPVQNDPSTNEACDDNVEVGEARLYALNYADGRSVHENWSDEKEADPVTREEIRSGGKADRFIRIGSTIPSAPLMVIRNGVSMLYIGVGNRLMEITPKQSIDMNMYYWREVYGAVKEKIATE